MAVASLMPGAHGIVMVIPPSNQTGVDDLFWLNWKSSLCPSHEAGLFSGGYMSANDLALKFSTAPAEKLIGVLPVLEVKEALYEEVSDDVMNEVSTEHGFEIEFIEQICDAFASAMKLAIKQPAKEARATLKAALREYPGYDREPDKTP